MLAGPLRTGRDHRRAPIVETSDGSGRSHPSRESTGAGLDFVWRKTRWQMALFRVSSDIAACPGASGRVAEWFKAAVLKTAVGCKPTVGSNPTSSASGQR